MFSGESIWLTGARQTYSPLRSSHRTDAVIVGGGLTGIQAAYLLCKAGLRVTVLEQHLIGSGTSGHSSAKVSVSQGLIYSHIRRQWGVDAVKAYGKLQSEGFEGIQRTIEELGIHCRWRNLPACTSAHTAKEMKLLEKEAAAEHDAGLPTALFDGKAAYIPALGVLQADGQASFDPYAYLIHLAAEAERMGVRIHEQTRVDHIDNDGVYCGPMKVSASHILLCTRYPAVDFPGGYCFRLSQRLGFIAAVEGAPVLSAMYKSAADGGYSLRSARDCLLLGAFDLRCGQGHHKPFEAHMLHMAKELFPSAHVSRLWADEDCFTADHLPYVGPLSSKSPHILIATGYQKWGMTNSFAAAKILARTVTDKTGEEDLLFAPQRPLVKSLWSLAAINGFTALGYLKSSYRLAHPKCPHMGGRLVYRPATKTWECPCHGSRFKIIGQVINTPAKSNAYIRLKKRLK